MTESEWNISTDPAAMLEFLRGKASVRKLRLFGATCCQRAEVAGRWALIRRGIDIAYMLADGQQFGESLARLQSELLYEGFSGGDGFRRKRAGMARWHLALAVFNTLQDSDRFRAGERRPVFEATMQDHHDDILHFALSNSLREAGRENGLVFDRPDICRPDLTRVWTEAALAVAYHRQPDGRPDLTLFQSLTQPDDRRRRDDWDTALEFDFRHEAEQQALFARDIFHPFALPLDPRWQTPTVLTLDQGIYTDRAFDRLPILADAVSDVGCSNNDLLNHCRSEGPHTRGCWAIDLLLNRE